MKVKFVFIIGVFLLAFSSCRECTVCTKSGDPDVRYCEKDFDSNTAYGLAVDIKEADGYNCR
jgi:hypothetical protein